MSEILVIGSQGQLASCLKKLVSENSSFKGQIRFLGRDQIDLSDSNSIEKNIPKKIECIINAAAYTQVDKAESEEDLAEKINGEACGGLAKKCQYYFGVSTDYVFSGQGFKPYKESDPVAPVGVYGRTKVSGEQKAIAANPNSIIVRTSWLYSEFGHNFLKTMLKLGADRKELKVVTDQVGTPTDAMELAKVLLKMVENRSQIQKGIYHFSNEGVCSWYDFAVEIFRQRQMSVKVHPIPSEEYPTPAKRPHYSVLDKAKIKKELQIEIPHWAESLRQVLTRLN